MSEIRTVEVSGSPYDRGYEYGVKCKEVINKLVESHYSFYNKNFNMSKDKLRNEARKYTAFIEDYSQEIMDEIRGTADGASVSLDEIVMIVSFVELYYPKIFGGCTSFAVTCEVTRDGSTYLGQNNDEGVDPWLGGDCCVLVKAKRKDGPNYLTYTYAGIPGAIGINSSGIALCLNGLLCDEHQTGVPGTVIATEILQQKNVEDAIKAVTRAKRANSMNFFFADGGGEVYDIEATPSSYEFIYVFDSLSHTNHFLNKGIARKDLILSSMPDTVTRYFRMSKLLRRNYGKIDLSVLMEFTKDHANYPNSICRHENPSDPPGQRSKTFDSMIFEPSKLEMWLAHGNPCQNAFHKYTIS